MGLRKEITAVLETKVLDVDAALLKIVTLVRAEKPKKVKADKPLGLIEIRTVETAEEGLKAYKFNILADAPLLTSTVDAAISALKQYRQEVSLCDCEICKAINKAKGEI